MYCMYLFCPTCTVHIQYFAWVDQTHHPFYIHAKAHFLSHMTNTAHLGSHMTNIEHFWSHVMNIPHFSSHTTNTATVLLFKFIGTAPSAAFVNASASVGDAKRLHLPRFDGYLSVSDNLLHFAWFSIKWQISFSLFDSPFRCESTHVKTIYRLKHRREYYMWTGTHDVVSIDITALG